MREPRDTTRPPGMESFAGLPAVDFWNALMGATFGVLQEQLLDWVRLSERGMEGKLPFEELMASSTRSWLRWLSLSSFPFEWATRSTGRLPTVAFVIDTVQEAARPIRVTTPAILQDAELVASDLVRVGGASQDTPGGPPPVVSLARCVAAELLQDGRTLEVRLVDLSAAKIVPGLYAGMVYGRGKSQVERAFQPLALVLLMAAFKGQRHPNVDLGGAPP
ncbi:hypothetical protein [Pyxidicoccus xibeiensis]|uniref:hypothetical protein n=1 Tax=Pyxidicoccus xibeiensis TaxID=2906759 RepID=UPI0020A7E1F9|nr:hypothetical protein [Pyxidicoccus xibeiensis]MCP3144099.1 hypothetical protein [Pyxidicoccus xibeiensis]